MRIGGPCSTIPVTEHGRLQFGGGGGYVSHLLTYFENTTEAERSKPTADYFIMPPTTLPASNSATFFMTITSDHCGGPVGTVSGNPGGTCTHGSSLICHLSI